jgi:hypothetical protein
MKTQALTIGWASRDVSTSQPVGIHGQFHLRISEAVLDPITVTALAIDNGEDAVIFVSGDVTGFQGFLVRSIQDRVRTLLPDVPVEKIVLHATHTHTTGDLAGMTQAGKDYPCSIEHMPTEEYREFFVASVAEAIGDAWHNRKPGYVAWGYGYAVAGHSRRTVYFDDTSKRPDAVGRSGMAVDGHAVMYGKTSDPMFSHFEAGADHFVHLLYTFDAARQLTGAIINVPCPSQCSEHASGLSADFWHEVRQNLRKTHGNLFVLPQCAAAGDLSPRILHGRKAQQRRFALKGTTERQEIADRITAAFDEVLAWASKDLRDALPLKHERQPIELARRRISKAECDENVRALAELDAEPFATTGSPLERLKHDSILAARRNRSRRVIQRYQDQDAHPSIPMTLHVVKLGEIAFAFNPFELYMDFMHRIQARSPFEQTFVVQLTGDGGSEGYGYLATERALWGGGYSASIYCNQVSPAGGQELVEATLKLLYV